MNYVLDAGPLIAFFNNEPGAEIVEDLLTEPGSACYTHAYNVCEVYYVYYRRLGPDAADTVIQDILDAGVIIRGDNGMSFWKDAGSIKARHSLALPDAFCIALARELGGTLITTDHAEFDPLIRLGYCAIRFIR